MARLRVGKESMREIGGRHGVAGWISAKERCRRARERSSIVGIKGIMHGAASKVEEDSYGTPRSSGGGSGDKQIHGDGRG